MTIVDAQIHLWDDDRPGHPWDRQFASARSAYLLHGPAMTDDRVLAEMDRLSIDAALITSFLLYADIDYYLEAASRHPDRFRIVAQIDLQGRDPVATATAYAQEKNVVGLRLSLMVERRNFLYRRLDEGDFDGIFTLATSRGMPIMIQAAGNMPAVRRIALRHPDLTIIIDHLGMVQGPRLEMPIDRFEGLDSVVDLAGMPNVWIKLTGAPTLSQESFPFTDLWPALHRLIDAYSPERVMWGTDFTRTRSLHTYDEAVEYLRESDELSIATKREVMGGSVARLFGWPRTTGS